MTAEIALMPIGQVRNQVPKPRHHGWDEIVSEIVLDPSLSPALDGIEEFSHLVVLFWLHQVTAEERRRRKIHPKDRLDLPLVGVLATRTQYRPNPIGLSVVKLLERRGNVLKVLGLDATNGTLVLDLKPWIPERIPPEEVRLPAWLASLFQGQDALSGPLPPRANLAL